MNEIDFIMLLSANVPLEEVHENHETVKIFNLYNVVNIVDVSKHLTIFSMFLLDVRLIMVASEDFLGMVQSVAQKVSC